MLLFHNLEVVLLINLKKPNFGFTTIFQTSSLLTQKIASSLICDSLMLIAFNYIGFNIDCFRKELISFGLHAVRASNLNIIGQGSTLLDKIHCFNYGISYVIKAF